MDQTLHSSVEVEQLLYRLGFEVTITQITTGALNCRLRMAEMNNLKVIRIDSNQGLLFYGNANENMINIALEQSNNLELHHVQGIHLEKECISGFNSFKDNIFFCISPGAKMRIACLSRKKS